MSDVCPCCGQPLLSVTATAEDLYRAMGVKGPRGPTVDSRNKNAIAAASRRLANHQMRDLYRTQDGRWLLTYGHWPHEPKFYYQNTVDELAASGRIYPPWPECQNEYFRAAAV